MRAGTARQQVHRSSRSACSIEGPKMIPSGKALCICPLCSGTLRAQAGAKRLGQTAKRYEDCLRVCDECGIALSNSISKPTYIRRHWRDGVWRDGSALRLAALVGEALNERNRGNKLRRLAHERSEDMLTWNVFSWIEEEECGLTRAVEFLTGSDVQGAARIYYWGVNDRDPEWTPLFRDFLVNHFREAPDRLSEPDIIIETDRIVVFVEVKFTSANQRGEGEKLGNYLSDDWIVNESKLRAAGMYELIRNWAIGLAWARTGRRKRRFFLVNLVRESDEPNIEEEFGTLVKQDAGQRFRRATWESLVRQVCPELAERFAALTAYFRPAFPGLGSAS